MTLTAVGVLLWPCLAGPCIWRWAEAYRRRYAAEWSEPFTPRRGLTRAEWCFGFFAATFTFAFSGRRRGKHRCGIFSERIDGKPFGSCSGRHFIRIRARRHGTGRHLVLRGARRLVVAVANLFTVVAGGAFGSVLRHPFPRIFFPPSGDSVRTFFDVGGRLSDTGRKLAGLWINNQTAVICFGKCWWRSL